jgi:micrococcal nuclease
MARTRQGARSAALVALLLMAPAACAGDGTRGGAPDDKGAGGSGAREGGGRAATSRDRPRRDRPRRERPAKRAGERARVAEVIDGDTLRLWDGRRVRLLQIDTPERGEECYAARATAVLAALVPTGERVRLVADTRLDRRDSYGRLLRYVVAGGRNANLELVRRGAAMPYFYRGERGRYAAVLLRAARAARAAGRGLWAACPAAVLDPDRAASTSPPPAAGGRCDRAYPGVSIPSPPPDLDCADVRFRDFAVRPPDPHNFDGGGDGIGCESEP